MLFVPIGSVLLLVSIIYWFKPQADGWDMAWVKAGKEGALPTNMIAASKEIRTNNWWGMMLLIVIEVVAIGAILSSYYYLRGRSLEWPLGQVDPPDLLLPTINSFILWIAIIPMYLSVYYMKRGNQAFSRIALVVMGLMSVLFVVLKVYEYSTLNYNWAVNAYTSIIWLISGFHISHVLAVVFKTAVVGYYAFRGYYNEERYDGVLTNALYGYFVSLIWIPMYFTVYLAPYLLRGPEG